MADKEPRPGEKTPLAQAFLDDIFLLLVPGIAVPLGRRSSPAPASDSRSGDRRARRGRRPAQGQLLDFGGEGPFHGSLSVPWTGGAGAPGAGAEGEARMAQVTTTDGLRIYCFPNRDQPEAFNRAVLEFLAGLGA